MRAGIVAAAFVAAVMMLLAAPAVAQLSPQWETCTGEPNVDPDQQIASCTALIESGQETAANLAIAVYRRAIVWHRKRDFDRAIADYSGTITLNPKQAYLLRPGPCLERQERLPARDRRLQRSDPPRPEIRRCLLRPG
jgi:hypothetical protein